MDQYNDAVQHPQTAFSDPVLKSAKIAANGMGLPIALGGGFALTYMATAQGRKFAIRCFHKEARGLEVHYDYVNKGLRTAGGPYFVGFEYQPTGVLVNGNRFPIVRMDWVEGDTLGSFLEDNHSNKGCIDRLRAQFGELERFLRSKGVAHGDLQNGNVLVKSDLKLIDYDGIYVLAMPTGHGAELGHKHFQHPKRSAADFGPDMDRFSFIVIDLSLRAIAHDTNLFSKYSNGENIIFTANDFIDPGASATFVDLKAVPTLARDAMNFASICAAPVKCIPTLEDFLAGKNIPAAPIIVTPQPGSAQPKQATYVGAYDVVDATDFVAVAKQVGNRVEFVGRVTKVHVGSTKYGKPFCFVYFNDSRQGVKLNIWSEGIAKLSSGPSPSWVGTWLSVQGLVDPAYSGRYGTSFSITITDATQLRKITEAEAKHRLGRSVLVGTARTPPRQSNSDILKAVSGSSPGDEIRAPLDGRRSRVRSYTPPPSVAQPPRTANQAILAGLGPSPATTPSRPTPVPPSQPTAPKKGLPGAGSFSALSC